MQIGAVVPNIYRDARALCAVGIMEHVQGKVPGRSLYNAEDGQANLRTTLDMARELDQLGFDHISVSEHHYFPLIMTPNAAVLAAALLQVVRRAKIALLGPIVSVVNPVRVAEEIALLDQLTGGDRLLVYLLKGTPNEHQYYGFDWEEARARSQEAALLIKKALTEDEQFAWHGEHWNFPVVSVWPGATTKPHPPIYTSGSQPETFEFAAAHGFGIATGGSPEYVGGVIDQYRAAAEAAGWTPTPEHVLLRGTIALGKTDAHAEELAENLFPHPDQIIHAAAVGSSSPHEQAQTATAEPAANAPVIPPFPVMFKGDPETVLDQARDLAKAGVGVVDVVSNFGGISVEEEMLMIRRLGELLPQIQSF